MFKLFAGMTFLFIIGSVLSALFDGNSFSASTLREEMSDSTSITTVPLTSAASYLNPGGVGKEVVINQNEVLTYSGVELTVDATCSPFSAPCLTGVDREQNSTDAKTHAVGSIVYTEALGTINSLMSFQVVRNTINFGSFNTFIPSPLALIQAVTPLILFDYAYLEDASILRMLMAVLGVGFAASLFGIMLTMGFGLFAK